MSSCITDFISIPIATPVEIPTAIPVATVEKSIPVAVQRKRDRNVMDVIQRLLEIIPEDQTLLRGKIIEFVDTTIKNVAPRHKHMWNQAPELMNSIYFEEIAEILTEYNPVIDTDWKRTVVKVFANQE